MTLHFPSNGGILIQFFSLLIFFKWVMSMAVVMEIIGHTNGNFVIFFENYELLLVSEI